MLLTKTEILGRIKNLYNEAIKLDNSFDAVLIFDKTNMFYFSDTMQDGVFVLKRDGSYALFVRKSYERAKTECAFPEVFPMQSYKDVAEFLQGTCKNLYLEKDITTLSITERLKKYINYEKLNSIDLTVLRLRAVKSAYELFCMKQSGEKVKYMLDNVIPKHFYEGMNEAELSALIYLEMIKSGHHGVTRFSMFQTEMFIGTVAFSENTLYPTSFDGPCGMKGLSNAAPLVGDRERKLKKGDLIFVDIGYGVNGYHTDKTQLYSYKEPPPRIAVEICGECIKIQQKAASMLKTGAAPADVYKSITGGLDTKLLNNFMGFQSRRVKFIGHGVGLKIDEYPVIASGFNEPLCENVAVALEPKNGIENYGTVGVEDTYYVTKDGGKCLTGGGEEIRTIYK